MDTITENVRAMYEAYPYPSHGTANIRADHDVRQLLSHVERGRQQGGPLKVLDAGCGRGVGLLGAAALQPDIQFLGADLNRVALEEAREEAKRLKLSNVQFQEVDLMTLEGLVVPEGGFDVIHSSGVLHHLSDPSAGLRRLREILAPHGVMAVMLYGKVSRQPLYRLIHASEMLAPHSLPIAERIGPSRLLAREMAKTCLLGSPWAGTAVVNDVEYVDRVLNVNETSYDIESLWKLLSDTNLKFLRFSEPEEWAPEVAQSEKLREVLAALPEYERYRIIEQIAYRHSLLFLVSHESNTARAPLELKQIQKSHFALNPDTSISITTRHPRGPRRVERVAFKVRQGNEIEVTGIAASIVMVLSEQSSPFTGAQMLEGLSGLGMDAQASLEAIAALVQAELLYRPHPTEC